MRRFHWSEISGDKDCIQCACLGETSILTRKLTLLQGNDASVRFYCEICGFSAIGIVSVDGSETTPADVIQEIRGKITPKPRFNRPAITDPLETPVNYVPPKTDAEAVRMAFGEVSNPEEFQRIIEGAYDTEIEIETPGGAPWRAERRITPTHIKMGDQEVVDVLVEFVNKTVGVVFSRKHSSTEGLPDMDRELKDLRESCLAVVRPPAPVVQRGNRSSVAQGPVAVQSNGWGSSASVVNNGPDPVREKLMSAFRGGG